MVAIRNGLVEGAAAASLADDDASKRRLRRDFLLSRLLKWWRLPNYNALRVVSMGGMTVHYRFNRGDLQSLREVLVDQVYACELPFAPVTFLDLGANIGLASLSFSRWVKPRQGQSNSEVFVVAVEPVSDNAAVAERNFRDNALNGHVVRAAVAQKPGEAWFAARHESNLGSLTPTADAGVGCLRVPLAGIRELLNRCPDGRADVVKMDIEGGEQDLLGCDLDWLKRVRALLVEWHEERADPQPLIRNLESAGFTHQRINAERQDNLSLFLSARAL